MNAHTHAYRRPAETTLSQAGANMLGAAARFIASVRDTLARWIWRSRYRDELEHLSDRQLRDMGLSRDEVAREVTKPFWRA
jgi:uncharacterized protein YjiS (DUF1127 family)